MSGFEPDLMVMSIHAVLEHAETTCSAPPVVTVASDVDRAAWDGFVSRHPDATGYHEWSWRRVFHRAFGHESIYLAARQNGRIAGVLPLVYINSVVFGRTLTSLPFLNYGGVVADSDSVARALVDAAADVARARRCRHVELRHVERQFPRLPCQTAQGRDAAARSSRNVGAARSQGPESDSKGTEIGPDRRARRRRAASGFLHRIRAKHARPRHAGVFAALVRRSSRDVSGSGTSARRAAARSADRGRTDAIRRLRTIEVPWASSIRDYNALCPNHLLYWSVIECGCRARLRAVRLRTVDAGRRHVQVQGAVGRSAAPASLGVRVDGRRHAAERQPLRIQSSTWRLRCGRGCRWRWRRRSVPALFAASPRRLDQRPVTAHGSVFAVNRVTIRV